MRRALSRRDFLKLSGAGLAGATLLGAAGCGGGGQGGGGGGKLVFSFGPDDSGTLEELVKRWNDQNPDTQVEYREMPADTGQYFDQMRTQFQGGGGDIDIIGGDVIWPAQFAANGWILDLSDRFTEEMRKGFLPGPIESNTYEGSVYGVPWFTDAGMMYYRQDLLEEAGISEPPGTWDEFKQVAQEVAQQSNTNFGFVFQGAQYEGGVVNGLEYIWSYGGDALDPNDPNKVTINNPSAVEGMKTEHSMVSDGISPQAVSTYKEQETHAAFLRGDAVFARNWPYMYALASDPEQSKVKPEQIGVTTIPVGGGNDQTYSGLGGWNFYINASTQNPDGAFEFIKFMVNEQNQRFRALEGSFLPTLQSLYEDQEVLDQVPVIALGKDAIQNTRPRPISPYYSDMSLEMQEQFNGVLRGNVPPEQAMKNLQQSLQDIIEQGA